MSVASVVCICDVRRARQLFEAAWNFSIIYSSITKRGWVAMMKTVWGFWHARSPGLIRCLDSTNARSCPGSIFGIFALRTSISIWELRRLREALQNNEKMHAANPSVSKWREARKSIRNERTFFMPRAPSNQARLFSGDFISEALIRSMLLPTASLQRDYEYFAGGRRCTQVRFISRCPAWEGGSCVQ